jgi:hypothetical protein
MKFRTEISLPSALFSISHRDKILMTGSCFVENMAACMQAACFSIEVNPAGVLYNPVSIASCLSGMLNFKTFTIDDLFFHKGLYHSFFHHSRFSGTEVQNVLHEINTKQQNSAAFLQQADVLIVTFGTARVYRLISSGEIVSNCHKLPSQLFVEERLSVQTIVELWNSLIRKLQTINPNLKIIFTVSPIRHWKNGANENQLNKAILLLTVDELTHSNRHCCYFPSYEIMMDDLRDYRFYTEDMIHPNTQAINYIWEKFGNTYFSKETIELINEWKNIQKALNHKPFHPESEEYSHFKEQTEKRKENFFIKLSKC